MLINCPQLRNNNYDSIIKLTAVFSSGIISKDYNMRDNKI